ncbi:Transcription elongation factor SPT6 [Orchesella cincta]|uniref:Transcription elongation factor SPT6 n=1 Tax=Orchesella cincta TaxID=48709 RepID=A0A1D2MXW7_ORCCI|nr:Transcription elongation factor SPT6 [Orchesella cincta]
MSQFVDSEAEESDGDGEEMEEDVRMIPKKSKKVKAVHSDDEDDEEEDDGEVVNDLIDDNPIEEDDSEDDESDGSRKRKKSDDEDELSDRLEDDDYDLIEENLGVKVQRKKFKRLKRIEDEDSDQEEGQDQGEDREAIANQLFEGSDNEEERREPVREETTGQYASEESEGEYSETDDFIVDDEGRPLKEVRRKRKPIFTDATLQEAQDIFGVDFDYEEFEKYEDEYYEEDEDEEEDEYEDEEGRTVRREKKQPRRRRKMKSIYEIYEPHELERAGFTDEDNKIRNQDIPERMQLRSVPITPANDDELDEEAEWIYKTAFSKRDAKKEQVKKPPDSMALAPVESEANWDDDWDKQTVVPGPPQTTVGPAAGADENWEEDDEWDKPKVPAASAPISKPPGTQVGDQENWEDEDWDAGPKKATGTDSSAAVAPDKPQEEVKPQIIPKIRKALEFMRIQLFEVPFIAFYRKEYVQPDLSINDLWKIYRLDARFCQLKNRKSKLIELFRNMREHQTDLIMAKPDDPISDSMRLITDEDLERIKSIKSADELKDMYLFFSLYYADEVPNMKEGLIRKRKEERQRARNAAAAAAAAAAAERGEGENGDDQPPPEIEPDDDDQEGFGEESSIKRKIGGGAYSMCKKMGVDSFVKKFGLPPEKFAENLRDNYQRHEVDQYPSEPLEAAKEMLSERLKTPEEVLKAAKLMMATQISREPDVRRCVREVFFERATISCHPTKKGLKEIDEAHPCFSMKYIKEKPVRDLTADQFMKLSLAEEDRFLSISLGEKISGMMTPNYIDEVKQLFQKDEFSKVVQDWNDLRGECIEFAFEKLLYPIFRKELRVKLLEDSKTHVLKFCSDKMHNWLKIAPFRAEFPEEDEEEWDTTKGLRVLAIAFVNDYEQAAFACLVSPDGEPLEHLRLQSIIKNKKAFKESDRQEKLADLLGLKEFMRNKKPHAIVIGGESREALMIKEDVKEIVSELVSEEAFPFISVEVVDNQLAKCYANSLKAGLLDPLLEFTQLCNTDEEILCMRFHPLQDHVPKEELLEHLYLEFVNRTNEVGVDLNRILSYPHTSNLVQFTCGLGPRKATALLKILKQNNQRLENRTQLITTCHMGPKIFINCSGFIKIDTNSLGDSTESYVEVLDGSRVHPETYEWARKMAVDALEYDDEDANPASALEEILESPEKLKDLDLDAFAEELERQGFGNKSITLYDIRAELNNRYKDLRTQYLSPSPEEVFNMLTKETPETLYIGKLITATVIGITHKKPQGDQLDNAIPIKNEATGMWQCAFCGKNDFPDLSEVWAHFDAGACPGQATGIRIRLDNGISGFIPISKLSDSQVTNPSRELNVAKPSTVGLSRLMWNASQPAKDPFYDQEREDHENKKEDDVRKNKQRQTYIKRVIVHPSFKNISYREVEVLMDTMDQGEVIVRPSSKGANHLTVTWKVADGVYQHIDVKEEGKENAFSLGQSLLIGTDEFEDLDEIIARHVNPMASHARDLINFKYYLNTLGGSRQRADEYLLEEKAKNANKIHYLIQASKEYPGKFLLSYLPRTKPVHEFVTVTPEGFRYRHQNFDSLNQLLKWFKEHFRDPLPASMTQGTPKNHASRTPYATTPGYNDGMSRVGAPTQSHFSINPAPTHHTTPHYTTPAQAFTPYSAFTAHTPYTPTAQTPYMTPYQTPYQSGTTPRFPSNNQPHSSGSGGFLHPGAVTPGYKTPQQRSSQHRSSSGRNSSDNSGGEGPLDWRKAAEAYAKSSQQKGVAPGWPSQSRSIASSVVARYGGSGSIFGGPPKMAPKSPATRNAAQVIHDGIQKTKQLSSAHNYIQNKSPRSGRESLKSTPRTNFSPRSMVESCGDETPLHDEN